MAKLLFTIAILIHVNVLLAQSQGNEPNPNVKQLGSIGIQYDNYLMGHPFLFKQGLSVSYSQPLWKRKKHHVSVSPRIGWISIPNVENKFFLNPTINYHFLPKRFYSNFGVGIIYTASVLSYDRYEYSNGVLSKQSSVLHNVGASAHLYVGYNLYFIKNIRFSPYLGFATSQFYKGYDGKFFDGYKPSISIGINISKNSKR